MPDLMFRVAVAGLKEAIEDLQGFSKYMVLYGFSAGLNAAANVLYNAIEAVIPIQLKYEGDTLYVEGGDLKGALKKEIALDANYRGGIATLHFGNQDFKAAMVEYGHRMMSHGQRGNRRQLYGPKTPDGMVRPYPFVRPAVDAVWEAAIAAFLASVDDTVFRARQSGAQRAA